MDNKNLWRVLIAGSVLVIAVFLSSSNVSESKKETEVVHEVSLFIPKHLSFAGEAVPLDYYDVRESLERELLSNSYFHSQTIYLLKKINRFFPIIEPILEAYNIPDDFKYLAVAESILMTKAKSPVGAAGVWQLMKTTAQELGLEVNHNVDERYNLELATVAACKYIQKSYDKYQNWTLVAASYNMGRRALDRSMDYQKEDNYYNMYLNSETARYVYRILAFKLILSQPQVYGFDVSNKDRFTLIKADTVKVNYPIEHLGDFAKEHQMNYKTLKLLNPWLLENHLNNASKKKYKILVSSER